MVETFDGSENHREGFCFDDLVCGRASWNDFCGDALKRSGKFEQWISSTIIVCRTITSNTPPTMQSEDEQAHNGILGIQYKAQKYMFMK